MTHARNEAWQPFSPWAHCSEPTAQIFIDPHNVATKDQNIFHLFGDHDVILEFKTCHSYAKPVSCWDFWRSKALFHVCFFMVFLG